jgi:hypothetical protein
VHDVVSKNRVQPVIIEIRVLSVFKKIIFYGVVVIVVGNVVVAARSSSDADRISSAVRASSSGNREMVVVDPVVSRPSGGVRTYDPDIDGPAACD